MKRNLHGCKVLVHFGLPIVPATLSCFSLVQEPSDGSLSSSCPVTRVQSWAIWLAGFLECGAQQEMESCLGDRRACVRPGLKHLSPGVGTNATPCFSAQPGLAQIFCL